MPNYELLFPNYPNYHAQEATAEEVRGEVLEVPDFEELYQQERFKNKSLVRNHALFSKFLTQVMPHTMNEDDSWEYLEGMIAEGLLPDPRTSKISVSMNLGCDQRLHLITPYNYSMDGAVHRQIITDISGWLKNKTMVDQQVIDGAIAELVAIFAIHGIEVRAVPESCKTSNPIYMYTGEE